MEPIERIVVKSEMDSNEEILLFYVDENGGNEQGIVTTIENMEQMNMNTMADDTAHQIYIEEATDETNEQEIPDQEPENQQTGQWTVFETKRLLIFFIDNKAAFTSGATHKNFLWSVACKTMLFGKTADQCEAKMMSLKRRYAKFFTDQQKGLEVNWQFLELTHQAFHDDSYVGEVMKEIAQSQTAIRVTSTPNTPVSVRKGVASRTMIDEKIMTMLSLYLKHKLSLKGVRKKYWQRGLWETIALEMGEEDAEYWHKRFQNFKYNYIRHIEKRKETGPDSINWPYMQLFDQIYENDAEFQKKHYPLPFVTENSTEVNNFNHIPPVDTSNIWNDTELTVLVKYCFDCFDEFQDPTIPNNFLWNEVGRLLDKSAEICKQKFEQLKKAHLEKYEGVGYNLANRRPIDIVFDCIISKTVSSEMSKIISGKKPDQPSTWTSADIDALVRLFHENMEMFKDPVCYYVCYAAVSKKLKKSVQSCRKQWMILVTKYKIILLEKKEDSGTKINWRYMNMFDRIFDYGTDAKLLEGYENIKAREEIEKNATTDNIGVKKVNIYFENEKPKTFQDPAMTEICGDNEDPLSVTPVNRGGKGGGDPKAFKILEFYQKNKEKFTTSRQISLWAILGNQIGMTAEQCAHRYRNLKQVYTRYVQREINKPEMPIVWPYYQLCKKVFGHKSLKNRLKNSKNNKNDSDDDQDWSHREINQLISYFGENFSEIHELPGVKTKWSGLSRKIGKSESACKEKFMELRKSYRQLSNKKAKYPTMNVTWKYFTRLDAIFNRQEAMEISEYEQVPVDEDITQEIQEDDDIQCIIVIPENQEVNDASNGNAQVMDASNGNAQVMDASNGNAQVIDGSTGNAKVIDGSTGNAKVIDGSTGNAKVIDGSTGNAKVIDGSTGNAKVITQDVSNECNENSQAATSNQQNDLKKWTKKTKKRLLILYLKYLRSHKGKEIVPTEMWKKISKEFPNKSTLSCRKMFAKLKKAQLDAKGDDVQKESPYNALLDKILALKPKFKKSTKNPTADGEKVLEDVQMDSAKVKKSLEFYLENIEEFVSPRFDKKYAWANLAKAIGETVPKVFQKINYLKNSFNNTVEGNEDNITIPFEDILREISHKELAIKTSIAEIMVTDQDEGISWSGDETEQLLIWYLANLDKFKNPKFVRTYLWMESSNILGKSPLACSKKMSEIRTEYRNMVRENPDSLTDWRFYELCQKIYGTGKPKDS